MDARRYDRTSEDVGNIVNLGHVNVLIEDQGLSTLFYITGLGLTRDPYLNVSTNNMWVNVGMSQFHLPTGKPQVLRGVTGLVTPDRNALLERLQRAKPQLKGTKFDFREANDGVETTCPWGNRIRVHAPDKDRFGPISLGMAYVDFDVRAGTAGRIAEFYRRILNAPAEVIEDRGGQVARVMVGNRQYFNFREADVPERPYDGDHVQVYVADFSGPYRRLQELGLVSEESNQHQYRFRDIVDLDTREVLFTIDHEVRSITHPMYGRPLVNRDPAQSMAGYRPGRDALAWSLA
jgi:hypothetical protein